MKIFSLNSFLKLSKKLWFNSFILLVLIYFIFHSIYGNRGVIAYFKLNHKLEKAYKELDELRANRLEVEHKVNLLRPGSLDKDMLDQKAREELGLASPNEQVFHVEEEKGERP